MQFTMEEKKKLVENSKLILDYLKYEIAPYINRDVFYKIEVNPREYKLVIGLWSKSKAPFSIYRDSINSTKYCIGDGYDHFNRENGKDFFSSYDEMFCLIENWQHFKNYCLEQIQKDQNIINNFTL